MTKRNGFPSIGMTGVWADPDIPGSAYGVPECFAEGLRRLGVYAGYREAFPRRAAELVRLERFVTRRGTDLRSVMLSREMRLVSSGWSALQRWTTPRWADAWVVLAAQRSVNSRYAILTDQSASQILGTSGPSMLLYPDAPEDQIRLLRRRASASNQHAHAICVSSHWTAKSLIGDDGVPAHKVKVVGYGVGAGHTVPEAPPDGRSWDAPSFLFVGFDWQRKNGDAVVAAFRTVRESHPDATLHLVGRHPSLSEDGVCAYGVLDRKDPGKREKLSQLFARATCFVMPSLLETFGRVYVEAATYGVGSIGSTVGGSIDAIGPGGLVVDPTDTGAIVKAMQRFCDPDFAREAGADARRYSELLSWDRIAQRVVRALDLSLPGVELADFL